MPPVLDPANSKVDGLAFLGLSLARKSDQGHPDSYTHQEAFDLNEVLDRDYEFVFSTNDDGWLVGGGEPGPMKTFKLAAKDSAHVEIMRIGTYRKEWGGVPQEEIINVMKSGEILIPQVEVIPTAVVANPDTPPELEIRFDMEPENPFATGEDGVPAVDFTNDEVDLPINWQLRFLHNQLFKKFIFPSRFCPGAFHSTILRKAEFRSEEHRRQYFEKCDQAIQKWRANGVKPLNTVKRDIEGNPITAGAQEKKIPHKKQEEDHDEPFDQIDQDRKEEKDELMMEDVNLHVEAGPSKTDDGADEPGFNSGIWLFTDRDNITHFFEPNFLPPYTGEKRKLILDVLKEEWDERTLSWKPCGEGSMTKAKPVEAPEISTMSSSDVVERGGEFISSAAQSCTESALPMYEKANEMLGEVISHIRDSCMPPGENGSNVNKIEDNTAEDEATTSLEQATETQTDAPKKEQD